MTGTMEPSVVRLWSIQHAAAWQHACQRGVLRADGRFVLRHFRHAYRWMRDQMALRLPCHRGGYPVWAWLRPKPDLRRAALLSRGQPGVCIELRAPRESILPSCFDAWHAILNDGPVSLNEAEHDSFLHEGCQVGQHTVTCRAAMEATWPRIFSLERPADADPEWWSETSAVQAVIPEVLLSAVVRVTPFIAR
jgi:hypothetical protein